jgi:hypothetical protein
MGHLGQITMSVVQTGHFISLYIAMSYDFMSIEKRTKKDKKWQFL